MPDKYMCDYALRRLEKSSGDLGAAQLCYNAGMYGAAANRAYYSVYHTLRAVLALDDIERKKHSGNISYFREHYIATGVFDRAFSDTIKEAESLRNDADYEDEEIVSPTEVMSVMLKASEFLSAARKYITIRMEVQ